MEPGAHAVGRFLGSLKSLKVFNFMCYGLEPALFEGLAEAGSYLINLKVEGRTLCTRASRAIASLSTLRYLSIASISCDVAPLASLKQLEALVLLPSEEVDDDDVAIDGLSEGLAGMQKLDYLRLPPVPSGACCFATHPDIHSLRYCIHF